MTKNGKTEPCIGIIDSRIQSEIEILDTIKNDDCLQKSVPKKKSSSKSDKKDVKTKIFKKCTQVKANKENVEPVIMKSSDNFKNRIVVVAEVHDPPPYILNSKVEIENNIKMQPSVLLNNVLANVEMNELNIVLNENGKILHIGDNSRKSLHKFNGETVPPEIIEVPKQSFNGNKETEYSRPRRSRKHVVYKEPPLSSKMRRS